MELISTHFTAIKNHLSRQVDFIDQMREIIHQVSGINLSAPEVTWRPPTLIINTTPVARNIILQHQEKIITSLREKFDRQAPKFIR